MKENWSEIEAYLSEVVRLSASQIDKKNIELLTDFIDNREYGVAYELITSLVSDGGLTLEPEAAQGLREAGVLMGFEKPS